MMSFVSINTVIHNPGSCIQYHMMSFVSINTVIHNPGSCIQYHMMSYASCNTVIRNNYAWILFVCDCSCLSSMHVLVLAQSYLKPRKRTGILQC